MQTVPTSDQLVTDHLPYSAAVTLDLLTKLNLHNLIRSDDAVGYARVGLMEAAARFRPDVGVSFATFSYARIRGAVLDGLRRTRAEERLLVGDASDAGDARAEDRTGQGRRRSTSPSASFDPTDLLDTASLRAALLPAINSLPTLDRQVILLHYFEDLTFSRIAKRLGLTKSWVARVHHKAIPVLARRLQRVGVEYGLVEAAR